MSGQRLDLREVPPPQRHPKVFDAFEQLDSGESLTLVNDHAPTPLVRQMSAELEAFDTENFDIERVGPREFVATLPKQ